MYHCLICTFSNQYCTGCEKFRCWLSCSVNAVVKLVHVSGRAPRVIYMIYNIYIGYYALYSDAHTMLIHRQRHDDTEHVLVDLEK